jgi:cell wall-associated NlpC family hydrolase
MRQWLIDHENDYAYSQGPSRLTPDKNMYTDCSGLMYWVYKIIANVYIGTWTGDQSKKGTLVTTSATVAKAETTLTVGDLVFYRWHSGSPSTYDHVAMYIGSNEIESHGGPDAGPDLQSHSGAIDSAIGGGGSIMVRRYV